MLTFYEEPFSHWCVKARKILDYKKIPYQTKTVGYHDKRELIKATGQDYVPALVNDGQIITYPNVPDFLEKLQPNPTIYPDDTQALAKVLENWAHYRREDVVWRYVVVDFPKTFKDDLERWVFVEIQELKRGPLELMNLRRPALKAEMDNHLQMLEDLLQSKRFLLAEKPSLADFAVFGALDPLAYSGNQISEKYERLRAWHESVTDI